MARFWRAYSALATVLLAVTWGGGWVVAVRALRQWPADD